MTAATYSVEDPFILITKKRPAADADIAIKAALIPEDTFFLQALVVHRLPFARRLMFKWRPAVSANGRCA